MRDFKSNEVIGSMRIRKDALPATPTFCFALGYKALEFNRVGVVPGGVPIERYIGSYELLQVTPIDDESYLRYLQQVGVGAAVPAQPGVKDG